jgi:hypothetical protein
MTTEEPFDPCAFRLHFEGELTRGHRIPSDILNTAATELQNIVRLLAMSKKEMPIAQRARIPKEIEQGFTLFHGLPEEGGYAQPVRIESLHRESLFAQQEREEVSQQTRDLIQAAHKEDREKIASIIPFPAHRKRILRSLAAMAPKPGTGVVLNLEDNRKTRIADMGVVAEGAKTILSVREDESEGARKGYITGKLIVMQFHNRILRLALSGSGRTLDAGYAEDYEPELVQSRRNLIQIRGNITYGIDNIPDSIYDVDEILPIDTDPIEVSLVRKSGIVLRARQPLSFEIHFDEEESFYSLTGPFGITLGAHTRPELEDMLYDCLAMLWEEYALEDPARLTEQAQRLRNDLRACLEEARDGI